MNKTQCEFIITSNEESPEVFSNFLGISPTRSFFKDEKYQSPSSGSNITRLHNLWAIGTEENVLVSKIDRHVSCLRKSLERKIQLINDLKSTFECDTVIWFWITTPDSVTSFDLSAKNAKFIGSLSAPVHFSIIPR